MANLADVTAPVATRRRLTTNTDSVLPSRRNTSAPALEVNSRIVGRNQSGADELRRTLGMVTDAVDSFAQLGQALDKQKQEKQSGQGALDGARGAKDEELFANSRAYRKAYSTENARTLSFSADQDVTTAVEQRLLDEDNPPDLQDINDLIDQGFGKAALDENGKPKDFGDPDAQLILARQFAVTRARLLAGAKEAIKTREDTKLVNGVAFNIVKEAIQAPDFEDKPTKVEGGTPPTGKLPVEGPISSGFGARAAPKAGASTDHGGIDIAAPLGSQVSLPATGIVVGTGSGGKRGNWVEVDHGGGVISRYFHLDSVGVRKGDQIDAGQSIGTVGATGNATGAHLHYSVLKDGKAVDPRGFVYASQADQNGNLAATQKTRIDFEQAMSRVPPTVSRSFAKKQLLQAFFVQADATNDPGLLASIEGSTRRDGSPSFSPDELLAIRSEHDKIENRIRVEADRARQDRYEAGSERLYTQWAQGKTPSIKDIRDAEARDEIPGHMAFTLINQIESEARQEARAARSDAREAQAKADADDDFALSSVLEARLSGDLRGSTFDDDVKRLRSGEFGEGKRAVARFNRARNAARAGAQVALQSPDSAQYAAQLKDNFGPKSSRGGLVEQTLGGGGRSQTATYAAMASHYRQLVGTGTAPAEAYVAAIAKYGDGAAQEKAKEARLKLLRLRAGR